MIQLLNSICFYGRLRKRFIHARIVMHPFAFLQPSTMHHIRTLNKLAYMQMSTLSFVSILSFLLYLSVSTRAVIDQISGPYSPDIINILLASFSRFVL